MKALFGAVLLAAALAAPAQAATPHVAAIRFAAEVNPVTQDWLNHRLQDAANRHDAAAVILLDTPGGLEDSMRKIVQKEQIGRASCRGKSVDLGGRRIIKKKT